MTSTFSTRYNSAVKWAWQRLSMVVTLGAGRCVPPTPAYLSFVWHNTHILVWERAEVYRF